MEGVGDIVNGIILQNIAQTRGIQAICHDDIVGNAFRQNDVDLKGFPLADGWDHGRIEIGFGKSQRRNRHLICGRGFVVVDGVAGIWQCADAHTGRAAVGTDQAAAVKRRGLSGQRGPVRLDGIVQDLLGLHDIIHLNLKGEADAVAGVDTIRRIPAENRLVGPLGRGVDIVRRIAAAHIAEIGQVQPIQVVQHSQVIGSGCADVGSSDGHCQDIVGIGIGHGKGLGHDDERFGDLDVDLAEIEHYRVAGFVDITCGCIGRRIPVGDHISVVGDGSVFDTADEPDLEIVTIADRAVSHALIAEIPFHKVVGASRGDGAARNEVCRRIRWRIQIDGRSFAAAHTLRQFVSDHEVAQQGHRQQGVEPVFDFFTNGHFLSTRQCKGCVG